MCGAGPRSRTLLARSVKIGLSAACPPGSGAGPGHLSMAPVAESRAPRRRGAAGEASAGSVDSVGREPARRTRVHAANFGSQRAGALPAPWF